MRGNGRRFLMTAAMTALAVILTSCSETDDSAASQLALPEDGHFVLGFDVACQPNRCSDLSGRYEVIYRDSAPVAARPVSDQTHRSPRDLHFLFPTPNELASNAVGDDFDPESGLPTIAQRAGIEFSGIDVVADLSAAAAELAEAEAAWAAVEIDNYRLELGRGCFCQVWGTISVEVNGEEITLVATSSELPPETVLEQMPTTVEALHSRIRSFLEGKPDVLEVEYDERGVPLSINKDDISTIDDEFTISGVSVTPIS